MPAGKGTYGNKVGRPKNKRSGEDYLDHEQKKKNTKTPDNFGYGDMPADFRKRYKEMLKQHTKKKKK